MQVCQHEPPVGPAYLDHLLLDNGPDFRIFIEGLVSIHPHQVLDAGVGIQVGGVELEHDKAEGPAIGGHALHSHWPLQDLRLGLQGHRVFC